MSGQISTFRRRGISHYHNREVEYFSMIVTDEEDGRAVLSPTIQQIQELIKEFYKFLKNHDSELKTNEAIKFKTSIYKLLNYESNEVNSKFCLRYFLFNSFN